MKALSRTQKIVLIVLGVLDLAVIVGLIGIVVTAMNKPQVLPTPTKVAVNTPVKQPTWTPTVTLTPRPTLLPRLTNTPTPTRTPYPTPTPTATPTPIPPGPIPIMGGDFDFLMPNRIPGWDWDAYVNYKPGSDYSVENSYAEPLFTAADDPIRQIHGTTLKVETMRYLKFRTWVHQTVTVTVGSTVYFEIKASAFSSLDRLIVKAGIDPTGAENCYNAQWGQEMRINQDDGVVTLTSPRVTVPEYQETPVEEQQGTPEEQPPEKVGRVTLCFYAEPTYPHVNNAAFFDQATLIAAPPRR